MNSSVQRLGVLPVVACDYLFDVPDGCHIHKVAGLDSLVLQ